ncbi:SpoIIE family protein phosphatase [Magnetofaba australis]|uniref:PPM-type phosphatase domain-containing protein n=1 Tax=Magnetofaba australis IT-1 TaxID=1434232 RepID=A0A1Y2K751_9PROT|nr:SpoIIE family protein phosphatase [Magnetofaba australis]OSM05360.1 putative protein serine/threonine phosphatase [Magnetofaba australis IT-1]
MRDDVALVCQIDGIGHGQAAEEAALKALALVEQHQDAPLETIFAHCDTGLTDTRGVSMALARVELAGQEMQYLAVGNPHGVIMNLRERYLSCVNGAVGKGIGSLKARTYPFQRKDTLILWSDGLPETLPFAEFCQKIKGRDLNLAAQEILSTLSSGEDDASIVLFRK